MKMQGEELIAAPRERVWEALNDPDVLKQCIPGCQSLEKEADDRLKATVAIKIGPIGARFNGAVTLSELDPPNSYVISGEGQGGAAGFARGSARVALAEEGGSTRLTYTVDAEVGGRLAQVGGPIIDATAKQLANTFFKRFGASFTAQASVAVPAGASEPGQTQVSAPSTAAAPVAPATAFPPSTATRSEPALLPWIVAVFLAALAGYLAAAPGPADPVQGVLQGVFLGLAIAAVAVFGYFCGRRAGPLVVTLDAASAALLSGRDGEKP